MRLFVNEFTEAYRLYSISPLLISKWYKLLDLITTVPIFFLLPIHYNSMVGINKLISLVTSPSFEKTIEFKIEKAWMSYMKIQKLKQQTNKNTIKTLIICFAIKFSPYIWEEDKFITEV